jgi:hypothetical protein
MPPGFGVGPGACPQAPFSGHTCCTAFTDCATIANRTACGYGYVVRKELSCELCWGEREHAGTDPDPCEIRSVAGAASNRAHAGKGRALGNCGRYSVVREERREGGCRGEENTPERAHAGKGRMIERVAAGRD